MPLSRAGNATTIMLNSQPQTNEKFARIMLRPPGEIEITKMELVPICGTCGQLAKLTKLTSFLTQVKEIDGVPIDSKELMRIRSVLASKLTERVCVCYMASNVSQSLDQPAKEPYTFWATNAQDCVDVPTQISWKCNLPELKCNFSGVLHYLFLAKNSEIRQLSEPDTLLWNYFLFLNEYQDT